MMWITFVRPPVPDATYWPGRRLLAVLDAVAWPAIAYALVMAIPGRGSSSLFVTVFGAACALVAVSRVRVAVWVNHRYRFTTWRLGRVVFVLLVIGLALKIAMSTLG